MIETWDNNHDNPNPYEEEKGKGVYLQITHTWH